MLTIHIVAPSGESITPASLLLRYAREHRGCGYKYGRYGKIYLRVEDKYYVFDSWKIIPLDHGYDQFTINLKEVEKGDCE